MTRNKVSVEEVQEVLEDIESLIGCFYQTTFSRVYLVLLRISIVFYGLGIAFFPYVSASWGLVLIVSVCSYGFFVVILSTIWSIKRDWHPSRNEPAIEKYLRERAAVQNHKWIIFPLGFGDSIVLSFDSNWLFGGLLYNLEFTYSYFYINIHFF